MRKFKEKYPKIVDRKRCINLTSFDEVEGNYNDEEDEAAIVHWNRGCIPQYISDCIKMRGSVDRYELSDGVQSIISSYWGDLVYRKGCDEVMKDAVSLTRLITIKKERIYEKQKNYLLDDDALAKIPILIRIYTEGGLDDWKNPKRDVLKFINFTLNEPKDSRMGPGGKKTTQVAQCYLDRLDSLPLTVVDDIFKHLDAVLAHNGRKLIHEFVKVDVSILDTLTLVKWFNELVIDDINDLVDVLKLEAKKLKKFLKGGADNAEIKNKLTQYLINVQNKIKSGVALYEYHIWNEPIVVTAVTLLK